MPIRLPPLSTLRLFEAAARLGSFRLAAEELGLTPSAISHGIQTLEEWLGTPLFMRTRSGLVPTEAGKAYYPEVAEALNRLSAATQQVTQKQTEVRISVAPTFGARILMPLVAKFQSEHPQLSVVIDTDRRQANLSPGGADLAIRMGEGKWGGLIAVHLMSESLVPVCSPELAAGIAAERTPLRLIRTTGTSQDWAYWQEKTGRQLQTAIDALSVDTIQIGIDAALRGQGILLGRRPIIDQELEQGRLVTIGEPEIEASVGYWLVGRPEVMRRPDVMSLRQWLKVSVDQGGATSVT